MFGTDPCEYDSSCRDYGREPQVNPYLVKDFSLAQQRAEDMQKTHIVTRIGKPGPANSNYRSEFKPEAFINCIPPRNDYYRKNRETMTLGDNRVHASKTEAQERYLPSCSGSFSYIPVNVVEHSPSSNYALAKEYRAKNQKKQFDMTLPDRDEEQKDTMNGGEMMGDKRELNAELVKGLQKRLNIHMFERKEKDGEMYETEAAKILGQSPIQVERAKNFSDVYKVSSIKLGGL